MCRLFSALVALVLAAGCTTYELTTGPYRLQTPFWSQQGKRIAIEMEVEPTPLVWRDGTDGFWSSLIAELRDDGIEWTLAPLRPDAEELRTRIAGELEERGFEVVAPEEAIDDDLLLSVRVLWGASRTYVGVVPLGAHRACFTVEGRLHQIHDALNEYHVLWRRSADGCEAMPRRWRDAEQIAALEAAVDAAWVEAQREFGRELFEWSGKWGVSKTRSRGTARADARTR